MTNIDDPIGKTIGRRVPRDPLQPGPDDIANAEAARKAFDGIPKGVYKFRSHEEADEWLMKQRTRRKSS